MCGRNKKKGESAPLPDAPARTSDLSLSCLSRQVFVELANKSEEGDNDKWLINPVVGPEAVTGSSRMKVRLLRRPMPAAHIPWRAAAQHSGIHPRPLLTGGQHDTDHFEQHLPAGAAQHHGRRDYQAVEVGIWWLAAGWRLKPDQRGWLRREKSLPHFFPLAPFCFSHGLRVDTPLEAVAAYERIHREVSTTASRRRFVTTLRPRPLEAEAHARIVPPAPARCTSLSTLLLR